MKDSVPQCEFVISDSNVLTGYRWHPNAPDKVHTVYLPDGIEEIGFKAMKDFECTRLVMPRSLKAIREKAFKYAEIEEIDFNGCNLMTIDLGAFSYCKAKTTLPDSVKSIGYEAAFYLKLEEENKLRLPSSLIHIGQRAVCLEDVSVLEIDERLATQDSDLGNLIKEDYANTWLILNVRRNGRLVWRVPVTLGISERSLFCEKGFNYYAYQNWYIDTTVRHKKIIIAAFLIMFDESMWFKVLRKYITSNFSFLMDGFEEDIEIIEFYNDAGLITTYRLKQLLENAIQKNNVEVAASILDLINCKSGFTAKSLQL